MYKEKQLKIRKDKINISFLLKGLYPYTLIQVISFPKIVTYY